MLYNRVLSRATHSTRVATHPRTATARASIVDFQWRGSNGSSGSQLRMVRDTPGAKKGGKRETARIVRKCVNSRRVRLVLHSSAGQSVIRAVNLLLIKREFRVLMNSLVSVMSFASFRDFFNASADSRGHLVLARSFKSILSFLRTQNYLLLLCVVAFVSPS